MKRTFKILGGILLLLVLVAGGFLAKVAVTGIPSYPVEKVDLQVEVTPARVARGKVIANLLCNECHLDHKSGRLTGHRLPDLPPEFGAAYSKNLTHDKDVGIGGWTDGELAFMLRTGINREGRYTPPWMPKLPRIDDEELASIIAFLRSDDSLVAADPTPDRESEPTFLVKFLTHVAFKPFEYPKAPIKAPDTADKVAFGRYLALDAFDCFACHSGDFKKMNDREPEKSFRFLGGGNGMPDLGGKVIYTANLTPDPETGIGKWSEDQFVKAVREGVRPDGRLLRYPMARMPEFTESEAKAIFAYLKTVPAIRHEVPRNFEDLAGGALSDGKAIYMKYGCVGCHGETGVGVGDLTLAKRDLPTDSLLRAWIGNPPSFKPLTKMPPFEGIIKEEEYAPLMAYVRRLGEKGGKAGH
jgi:mono/diheme cytochrome c family protein